MGQWRDRSALGMIVLKGLQGPITVKGVQYGTAVMQPWDKTLNDAKIADVLTYIRQEWGNKGGPVSPAADRCACAKNWRTIQIPLSKPTCKPFRKTRTCRAAKRRAPNQAERARATQVSCRLRRSVGAAGRRFTRRQNRRDSR